MRLGHGKLHVCINLPLHNCLLLTVSFPHLVSAVQLKTIDVFGTLPLALYQVLL